MAAESPKTEGLFKVIILGDSGVGKTSILLSATTKKAASETLSSTKVDIKSLIVSIGNRSVNFQLWDSVGQGGVDQHLAGYLRGAHGVVIVYDISNLKSYEHARDWYDHALVNIGQELGQAILVGNKTDIPAARRVVTTEEGKTLAQKLEMPLIESATSPGQFDLPFLETSATKGENVQEIFDLLARAFLKKEVAPKQPLSDPQPDSPRKSGCC